VQFDAVNPLCIRLWVVDMTHKAEASAPHLRNLYLITRLQRPTFGHLIGWGCHPMSVDLIVLWDKLTAVYFSLSHDTLSVVGMSIIPKKGLLVNTITYFIKNEISDEVIKVIVSNIRLVILNPI